MSPRYTDGRGRGADRRDYAGNRQIRDSFRLGRRNWAFCTPLGRQATAASVLSAGPILHNRWVRPYDPIPVPDDGATSAARPVEPGVVLSLGSLMGTGASHISAPICRTS